MIWSDFRYIFADQTPLFKIQDGWGVIEISQHFKSARTTLTIICVRDNNEQCLANIITQTMYMVLFGLVIWTCYNEFFCDIVSHILQHSYCGDSSSIHQPQSGICFHLKVMTALSKQEYVVLFVFDLQFEYQSSSNLQLSIAYMADNLWFTSLITLGAKCVTSHYLWYAHGLFCLGHINSS